MVRVILYNIEYCEGIEGRWYQYLELWKIFYPPAALDDRLIKKLHGLNPDILALVEVDTGSARMMGRDEAKYFSNKMDLKNFVEIIKYPFKSWLKLFHFVPIMDMQGNALISKFRLKNIKYHILHEGTKRVVIEATVKYKRPFTILLAHLSLGSKTRKKQIDELIKIVKKIKRPVILMGDFNTFHGKEEIKKLLNETHLNDMIRLDKNDRHVTEPSCRPTKRLDYILTSKEIKVKKYKILKFHLSDHLPVMIDFNFR